MHLQPQDVSRPTVLVLSAVLLVLIFSLAPSFAANPPATPAPQEQIKVTAHLDLPGIHVQHMYLQQRGDKSYLFLRRVDKNAFAVVDVTDPSKPKLVDRLALQEPKSGGVDLPAAGSVLAIAFVPDGSAGAGSSSGSAAAANPPTETIKLLNLSDPKHPKTIQTFKGVSSVATDDGRKLVFLVNDQGLWIVSHHRNRPLPMCTSEDAEIPEPECQ
jgi:hypothetical protein